jgi:hypothetical protein
MNGQPCVRGMRLTVRRVVEAIAIYPDRSELKREYPELEDEDIALHDAGQIRRIGFLKRYVPVPDDSDSMGGEEMEQVFGEEP